MDLKVCLLVEALVTPRNRALVTLLLRLSILVILTSEPLLLFIRSEREVGGMFVMETGGLWGCRGTYHRSTLLGRGGWLWLDCVLS
jgi:hypothetical protein